MAQEIDWQMSSLSFCNHSLTKSKIAKSVEESVDRLLEEGNVLSAAEMLAIVDEFPKLMRKDERFVQAVRDEVAKYNGRLQLPSGAVIENCEAGVSYDYSANADWVSLNDDIHRLLEDRKKLEARLRGIQNGKTEVDHETGEVINGAIKTSKSTYRITLAK